MAVYIHSAFGACVSMVVGHVPVEKILMIPSNNPGVGPDPCKTTVDVLRSDGVKRTTDVKKGDKAVGLCVNVALNVVRKGGGSGLRGPVTLEAMLMWVEGAKFDTLVNVPGTQPLQGFKEVVG